ncbi:hypothetical protein [Halogeometricum limi]|uniref:ZIP Zinc transporter n=1 Tax=Halogeometricum limi TaxID=555875 RepID=A0A1I6I5A1_9EURY|nr:hypothetical protein [Halogeometricum limi]SFR61927.1 hypothetical protein SAMN04488124_2852 [Halogeometricum limi]
MSPFVLLLSATVLVAAHFVAGRVRGFGRMPRSRWLSLGGGVSVAYVFVHVLPELTEHHQTLTAGERTASTFLGTVDSHAVFLAALFGFVAFYGLEQFVRRSRRRPDGAPDESGTRTSTGVFWLHVGSFAAYNALVGYLLVHRETAGAWSLAFYVTAMAVHFAVNDVSLREHHRATYDRVGRWVLAGAIASGVVAGLFVDVSETILGLLFAALAGGILLNAIKEELPTDRESRFWAFGLGATGYTALLLLT